MNTKEYPLFISERAKSLGLRLSDDAKKFLFSTLGENLLQIENALQHLTLLPTDQVNSHFTKQDLDNLNLGFAEEHIFRLQPHISLFLQEVQSAHNHKPHYQESCKTLPFLQ